MARICLFRAEQAAREFGVVSKQHGAALKLTFGHTPSGDEVHGAPYSRGHALWRGYLQWEKLSAVDSCAIALDTVFHNCI
jgi:hypothetical protein